MKKSLFFLFSAVIFLLPKLSFAQTSCSCGPNPPADYGDISNKTAWCACAAQCNDNGSLINGGCSQVACNPSSTYCNQQVYDHLKPVTCKNGQAFYSSYQNNNPNNCKGEIQCTADNSKCSTSNPTASPTIQPTAAPTIQPTQTNSPTPSLTTAPKKPVKIIISQFQRDDQIIDPSDPNALAKINLNFSQSGASTSATPTKTANVRFQVNYDSEGKDVAIYYVQYKLKQQSTSSSPLPSPDESGVTHLTSCGEITKSGNYVLDKDLSENIESKCLYIHDTENVNVNCQNHIISMDAVSMVNNFRSGKDIEGATLLMKNVHNFGIKSCNIQVTHADKVTDEIPIQVTDSQSGEISNNIIGAYYFFVKRSSDLKITNNKSNAIYQQNNVDKTLISDNNFLAAPVTEAGAGVVLLNDGSNNQVLNNIINGNSDGVFKANSSDNTGTDDGIGLFNETGDIIKNNTILNNWDCGIETSYLVKNTQFIGNKIKNSGVCGIGGWYWNSWLGNTVSNNTVEDSPDLFTFFRAYGLLTERNEQIAYFKDNTFSNNKLIGQKENGPFGVYPTIIDFASVFYKGEIPVDKWVLENNKFSDNDFSTQYSLIMRPVKMIVDGGGNICRPGMGNDFPLACGRSQPSNAVFRIQSINTKDLTNQVNKVLQTTESLTRNSKEQLPNIPQPTPTATPEPLKLIDFNGDGVINVWDYIIFAQKKLGK